MEIEREANDLTKLSAVVPKAFPDSCRWACARGKSGLVGMVLALAIASVIMTESARTWPISDPHSMVSSHVMPMFVPGNLAEEVGCPLPLEPLMDADAHGWEGDSDRDGIFNMREGSPPGIRMRRDGHVSLGPLGVVVAQVNHYDSPIRTRLVRLDSRRCAVKMAPCERPLRLILIRNTCCERRCGARGSRLSRC